MNFQHAFVFGRIMENRIAEYLRKRGYWVQPCYEIETEQQYKGPRIFSAVQGELIAPDLFVMGGRGKVWFVEAKCKSHFTWYRKKCCWNTGIDLHCYLDYMRIRKHSDIPIWLMFLHMDSVPSPDDQRYGCETSCPTGLFGQEILSLANTVCHDSGNHGRHGMIYWRPSALIRLATVEEIL